MSPINLLNFSLAIQLRQKLRGRRVERTQCPTEVNEVSWQTQGLGFSSPIKVINFRAGELPDWEQELSLAGL